MSAPRSRVSGEGAVDGSLAGGLVRVDEDFLAVAAQPHSPGLGLNNAVFGPEFARAQECHDGLVDQEWAELFHEVQRQAGTFVGGCVRDAEGRFEPGGVERADTFSQEDGVPVGQGGVGQVAGWASAAPIEGDVGGHAPGEHVEVGVGARAFDAHDLVEGARIRERATPRVHVCGRVGDVHGFVASGDAGEDVDLAADFRVDEAGGQADAARMVAGEGDLREEPTSVRSPVRTDEGALVGASPRQAHDVDAAAHRPRARAGGQADVSGQDDARDAVFRDGGGRQRAGRVDEDTAHFDMDARAIAADIEDAIGFAGGFVAGPGGPRVDADARDGFLLVNVLGRQVGEARTRIDGRGRDGVDGAGQALFVWRREHEGGSDARVTQASPSGIPVKIKQSGVGEHARDRVGVRGPGEFVDNGRVGVGQAQCRESRTGHEARVGDADGGSREVVVAVVVVVVVDESPAECVVSCARVVVGAVGAFRGEAAFEGFARRFRQEHPSDGVGRRESVRVKCGDAWRRPVARGEDVELFVGEASRRGGVRSGGVGVCCEESASGASEGFGAGCFSQGRGRGGCRHRLSFQSTTLRLLYKCEVLWRSDTPTMAPISGAVSAPQAFCGDASSRNEKSGNLTSCLLAGGVLFRPLAIRYDVFPGHRGYDTPGSQKAPSAKRCIIRHKLAWMYIRGTRGSESTEHQKVH